MFRLKSVVVAGIAAWLAPRLEAQVIPERGLFSESTGLVQAEIGRSSFRGSGVIARDPRLVFSCAHVLFENGVWATDYKFHRAYHSGSAPYQDEGDSPRGFRYFTNYASNTQAYGTTDARTYALDFVIYYKDTSFGDAVGWWSDGGDILRSDRWKRIIGYPSTLAYDGTDGGYYQHGTDWFSNTARQIDGVYHHIDGVSTGRGNSGGPVFGWDDETEQEYLAGILVSGDATLAGVHALSESTDEMASAALGVEPLTKSYTNRVRLKLPDGGRKYRSRSVAVAGFTSGIDRLSVDLRITTRRKGDLDVYLLSPTGRTQWINKRSADRQRNLSLAAFDLTSTFRGATANGPWTMRMRDARRTNVATFRAMGLTITAPGEP